MYSLHPNIKEMVEIKPHQVLIWLLGGDIEGLDTNVMAVFWFIDGYAISKMYEFFLKFWRNQSSDYATCFFINIITWISGQNTKVTVVYRRKKDKQSCK